MRSQQASVRLGNTPVQRLSLVVLSSLAPSRRKIHDRKQGIGVISVRVILDCSRQACLSHLQPSTAAVPAGACCTRRPAGVQPRPIPLQRRKSDEALDVGLGRVYTGSTAAAAALADQHIVDDTAKSTCTSYGGCCRDSIPNAASLVKRPIRPLALD